MEKKQRKFLPRVPEEALVIIWARFSLRSIARFRSVCKEWKSLIDSDFFRDLYESLSSSSSSVSWSIMDRRSCTLALEIVGHYGCERWGLTDTLGSWITRFSPETTVRKASILSCADGLVLLYTIKVWKLVNYCTDDDPKAWELLWELNTEWSLFGFGTDYFPVVMHPLNHEIIYLWSRNKNGLVLLNLRTHEFSLHKEEEYEENKSSDGCIMKLRGCKKYMDSIYIYYLNGGGGHELFFSQYVLPRWLNPLPQLSS